MVQAHRLSSLTPLHLVVGRGSIPLWSVHSKETWGASKEGGQERGAYFGSPHRSTLHPGSWRRSVRGTRASGSSACMIAALCDMVKPFTSFHYSMMSYALNM